MKMNIENIMVALLNKYGGDLYNSALTKLVYLVDIEAVKRFGEQASNINWRRGHYGPYVWDVFNTAEEDTEAFEVSCEGPNKSKRRIILKDTKGLSLEQWMNDIIEHIHNTVPNPKRNFYGFMNCVYETIPMILSSGNGEPLDIKETIQAAIEVDELIDETLNNPDGKEAFHYLAAN